MKIRFNIKEYEKVEEECLVQEDTLQDNSPKPSTSKGHIIIPIKPIGNYGSLKETQ